MDKLVIEKRNRIAEQKRHWVRLTHVCNQKCIFCHDKARQTGQVVPFKEILRDLQNGRRRRCSRVVLSGGEPTLHPRLPEIIKVSKAIGYTHVQVISNGRMFSHERFVKELKKSGLDEVSLSLHSHLKGPFEKITGVKGSYHQAMKGLKNVLGAGFIVSVDIVVHKLNYETLEQTLKFFMALGVSEFDLLHITPFGEAWENREKTQYPIVRAKKYLDKVFALSKKEHIYLWTNRLPAMYLEGYEELIQNPCKLADEIRGREEMLKHFVRTGKQMWCLGERCEYCFLNGFCKDLLKLREEKVLVSHPDPICLKRRSKSSVSYRFRKNMDLYKFLDFFIDYRYCVKSLRCQNCKWEEQCYGAHINEIRTKGFGILVPAHKEKNG